MVSLSSPSTPRKVGEQGSLRRGASLWALRWDKNVQECAEMAYYCFTQVLLLDVGTSWWPRGWSRIVPMPSLKQQRAWCCGNSPPAESSTRSSRKPKRGSLSPVSGRKRSTPLTCQPCGQRSKGSRRGDAARTPAVNQTRAQDWFPEFGFTSQYRNHLEPSGDTRSTGSVIPVPQCRLVRPRSHQPTEKYFHILPAL